MAQPAQRREQAGDVIVRRLRRDEASRFYEHLLRLDPEARRLRFSASVKEDFLRTYALAEPRTGTIIEGAFVDGVLRAVGEMRPIGAGGEAAEVAFSVEPGFRGNGLGKRLLDRLLVLARNHGVRLVTMMCSTDNVAMKRLFRSAGGKLAVSDGIVEGSLRPAWPTPFSLAKEALAEQEGAVDALLGGFARPRAGSDNAHPHEAKAG